MSCQKKHKIQNRQKAEIPLLYYYLNVLFSTEELEILATYLNLQ